MSEGYGIDMSRSGWQPATAPPPPRPDTPAPAVKPSCNAMGPGGFICDWDAGHPGEVHYADDGSNGGLRWATEMRDVSLPQDKEPVLVPGRTTVVQPLEAIAELAERALEKSLPAQWAIALAEIARMCRD